MIGSGYNIQKAVVVGPHAIGDSNIAKPSKRVSVMSRKAVVTSIGLGFVLATGLYGVSLCHQKQQTASPELELHLPASRFAKAG